MYTKGWWSGQQSGDEVLHGAGGASRPLGADPLAEEDWGGEYVQQRWVPSHLDVHRNEQADLLTEMGGNLHPNNLLPLSKRRLVTGWDALGLEPMEDRAQELTSGDDSGGQGCRSSTLKWDRTVMGFPWMSVAGPGTGRGGGQRHCQCGTQTIVPMSVTTGGGRAGG